MIVIVMGVTGSGKTTIGQMLASQMKWSFRDGDAFHPPANIEKMKQGIPLQDADRLPWLNTIREFMLTSIQENHSVVIACSALKQMYRELLLMGHPEVRFIHLKGDAALIRQRLEQRTGHFMNPKLLESQFATLEEPEDTLTVDISAPPETLVKTIRNELGL